MGKSGFWLAGALCLMASGASAQEAGKAASAPAAVAPSPAATAGGVATPTTDPAELKELRPGVLPGYLPREQLVDSLALLGPAPEPGSATATVDEAIRVEAQKLKDTARYRVAARDAIYRTPAVVDAFSCAIGVRISQSTTPHLNMLLRRTLTDAGLATYKAKSKYMRQRPYVAANDTGTCYADDEEPLRKDGSYPSGHAAFGWAWALILAEAAPQEANAIIRRGYDYGQSRVICGYHWQSDVNAGRLVGAAVVAQLHANPAFMAQLQEAKKEIAAARANGANAPDCTLDNAVASGG